MNKVYLVTVEPTFGAPNHYVAVLVKDDCAIESTTADRRDMAEMHAENYAKKNACEIEEAEWINLNDGAFTLQKFSVKIASDNAKRAESAEMIEEKATRLYAELSAAKADEERLCSRNTKPRRRAALSSP